MTELAPHDKPSLRRQLRARRRALSRAQQAAAAAAAARNAAALPGFPGHRHIALYRAADGELDPEPLAGACRAAGATLYLPCLAPDNTLEFARWDPELALTPNRWGIGEPSPDAPRRPVTGLDVLYLPLVGWDRQGHRLGMGGGFYDRTLADSPRPLLVGLAHATQELPGVPVDTWDVVMDYVLTDLGLHRCGECVA